MAYHTPVLCCGCGRVYPISNFMEKRDMHSRFTCNTCGTMFEITIHVPKDLLIEDVIQREEFEKIHGKIK